MLELACRGEALCCLRLLALPDRVKSKVDNSNPYRPVSRASSSSLTSDADALTPVGKDEQQHAAHATSTDRSKLDSRRSVGRGGRRANGPRAGAAKRNAGTDDKPIKRSPVSARHAVHSRAKQTALSRSPNGSKPAEATRAYASSDSHTHIGVQAETPRRQYDGYAATKHAIVSTQEVLALPGTLDGLAESGSMSSIPRPGKTSSLSQSPSRPSPNRVSRKPPRPEHSHVAMERRYEVPRASPVPKTTLHDHFPRVPRRI